MAVDRWVIALAIGVVWTSSVWAANDNKRILLKNGKELRGQVVELADGNQAVLDIVGAGRLTVALEDIRAITTPGSDVRQAPQAANRRATKDPRIADGRAIHSLHVEAINSVGIISGYVIFRDKALHPRIAKGTVTFRRGFTEHETRMVEVPDEVCTEETSFDPSGSKTRTVCEQRGTKQVEKSVPVQKTETLRTRAIGLADFVALSAATEQVVALPFVFSNTDVTPGDMLMVEFRSLRQEVGVPEPESVLTQPRLIAPPAPQPLN